MLEILKKPLVQFIFLGLILFGIQQIVVNSRSDEPIVVNTQVIEHLKNDIENEWQVKPDSFILNIAKEKWIEQELLYRLALENELDLQSDLVRKAMIQTAEDYILSQVNLSEPSDEELNLFMKTSSKVYMTESRVSFNQYYFGEDLIYAQKSLFDSKEIEIEGSETLNLPVNHSDRLYDHVTSDFGLLFSDSLTGKTANWRGIVPSKFGIHVVVINLVKAAKIAKLYEVKNQVLLDYRRQQLVSYRDSILTEMKNRIEIIESFK